MVHEDETRQKLYKVSRISGELAIYKDKPHLNQPTVIFFTETLSYPTDTN